jgi:ATP/maltotriose-dependent transcriptional regulator MalT
MDLRYLELVRRLGNAALEGLAKVHLSFAYAVIGKWDELEQLLVETPVDVTDPNADHNAVVALVAAVPMMVARGELDRAEAAIRLFEQARDPSDVQELLWLHRSNSWLYQAQGRLEEAHAEAVQGYELGRGRGRTPGPFQMSIAVETALDLGRPEEAERLVTSAEAEPAARGRAMQAHLTRLRGLMAARAGATDEAEARFRSAVDLARGLGVAPWIGQALLEWGEMRVAAGRATEAEPLVSEAREIFERLRATPWIERADRALASGSSSPPQAIRI